MPHLFSENDLIAARDAGVLSDNDYDRLSAFLVTRSQALPASDSISSSQTTPVRFDLTHVLWYAGALIIMTAMGLFTTEAFNRMGGQALTVTAVVYACIFLLLGNYLWRRDLRTPGGLAVAVAVAMTPMAVYGIQDYLHLWNDALQKPGEYKDFFPYINGSWLYMELATIIAAIIALCFYPFPFITMIAAVALWFMSMDLAAFFTRTDVSDFELRRQVTLWFGLTVMAVAWLVDLVWRERRFGFWLHLAGAAAFWGSLTMHEGANEWQAFLYCLINVAFVFLSVYLNRRIYTVFGAIGIATYLGHLASSVFEDSLLFSFALSAIGLLTIGLGIAFHKKQAAIDRWFDTRLPKALRVLRPLA